MKVTAIIDDNLINNAVNLSGAKNITEALRTILNDYVKSELLKQQIERLSKNPVHFQEGFTAEKIRKLNNKIT